MSFYNRGYGGLVRFPGLGRYGAFGDVTEAQDAVNAANAKLKKIQLDRANQLKLIAFTQKALNDCLQPSAGAIFTAGVSVAICVAEQETALGQRKGQLGQIDLQLNTAKGELAAAKQALIDARAVAESAPPEDASLPSSGGGGGSISPTGSSSSFLSSGGGKSLLSNPLVLGGGALVLALGAFLAFRKAPTS